MMQWETSNSRLNLPTPYSVGMGDLRSLVVQRLKEMGDPSPITLAQEHGLERSFINDIVIGKKKRVLDHTKLAAALQLNPSALAAGRLEPIDHTADESQQGTVPVVGYVGAGAEAHFYALSDGELDRVPAPDGATPETVAVEIRGESLGPLFERWLVHYDDVRSPITQDLVGQLCVVGLPDDRVLVKKIRRAKSKGMASMTCCQTRKTRFLM
ncbi:phage repressor protein [Devosia aurantiaca]|uniref:phage repressor protein n=1 Tax=Devosia aurantiaca TaxID=2714858 RepID=UPI001A9A0812|nr:phage repressor protein [Devosia aurantiaca]